MRLSRSFYLFLIIGIVTNAFGQVPSADSIAVRQASAQSDTLSQQYNEMINRLGINKNGTKPTIIELWKHVNDSLNLQKKLLRQSKAELEKSSQNIIAMKNEIDNLKASGKSIGELNTLEQSVNGSSNYLYLWGALLLLAAALAYAILRMRSAVKEANYRTALYDQLFEELRENRSKANEREKKLARELQTVRNRIEELTGK
jgi:predicted  nucleic acid-binding Zn-ribbon protein